MDSLLNEKKPCLVQTPQGFSIEYKNKYLYSKYNPSKNIENILANIEVLPGTIFLCFSPILDYGINTLLTKLKENCVVFLCEFNEDLHNYIQEKSAFLQNKNVYFPTIEELYNLPLIFNEKKYIFTSKKEIFSGFYKRIKRLDFSFGIQFNNQLYSQLELACINSLKTFWSNRVTLTKFGRKFSTNLFHNLSYLPFSTPISNYIGKIDKPIIVCGAGTSLENGIKDFRKNRNDFFILCADTAANFLIHQNVIPDGIFIEESQNIILESFFDVNKYDCHIFAGLSSNYKLNHYVKKTKNISFFTTEYAKSDFLIDIFNQNFICEKNPAFGSVGLTTLYFALKFRANNSIPIYIYGLDFSYGKGVTHVKNSIAFQQMMINSNKIKKIVDFNSCYNKNVIKINENLFTTQILLNYANLFMENFSTKMNVFDSRNSGISLNLPKKKPEITCFNSINNKSDKIEHFGEDVKTEILSYFNNEFGELNHIKNILINENNCNNQKSQKELNDELFELLYKREYLYLHFIDGYQLSLNKDFLNRIRAEIDFFLKNFEIIKLKLEKDLNKTNCR